MKVSGNGLQDEGGEPPFAPQSGLAEGQSSTGLAGLAPMKVSGNGLQDEGGVAPSAATASGKSETPREANRGLRPFAATASGKSETSREANSDLEEPGSRAPSRNSVTKHPGQQSHSWLWFRALQEDGRSLWPSKFPVAWLIRKRERMGVIRFNAQYQNDCELMHGKVFRQADLRHYDRGSLDEACLTVVQGVDVAVGQGEQHDYFALVTKGYDGAGRAYTLDVVQGSVHVSAADGGDFAQGRVCPQRDCRFVGNGELCRCAQVRGLFAGQPPSSATQHVGVTRIGIEAVAYQRVLPQRLFELAPALPLVCVQQRLDKRSRMTIYAARFENHLELFPNDNSCDALTEELLLFPDAAHDDLLDAHEIAHRVAVPVLQQTPQQEDTQVRVLL